MKKHKILITGAAGFIGYSICKKLLEDKNNEVVGLDNLNSYYLVKLKNERIKILKNAKNFKFFKLDLLENNKLNNLFKKNKFEIVYNFAAQAGVRYSFENPESYCNSNIVGFNNLLKLIKKFKVKKFFFASSSSVYGDIGPFPKKEDSKLNTLNIYSLSKLANEITARSFSAKMKTQIVGLRFFSIYGEWGRPDMLILKYLLAAKKRNNFELLNFGNHFRDFTYIDDAVNICISLQKKKMVRKFNIFNICSSKPLLITKVLEETNKYTKKPLIRKKPRDDADVYKTYGDNTKIKNFLKKKINFTSYKQGVKNTCYWFLKNNKIFD
tara:strand:- start:4708 stop:5682 length:975 start_codon:yes stop_codon:yes gene_type:complete